MKAPLAALLLLAASPAQGQQSCFRPSQLDDYKPLKGNRSLIATDTLKQKFTITFRESCFALMSKPTLVFKPLAPGSLACLQPGDTVLSITPGGGAPDRCRVESIIPAH